MHKEKPNCAGWAFYPTSVNRNHSMTIIHQYPDQFTHESQVQVCKEWLEPQPKAQHPRYSQLALKHIIEQWGQCYISQYAVEDAAKQLGMLGTYPCFNLIVNRLVYPLPERLHSIPYALSMPNYMEDSYASVYGEGRRFRAESKELYRDKQRLESRFRKGVI